MDPVKTIKPEMSTTHTDSKKTEVGSVFVSNYPPYSFWSRNSVPKALEVLHSPPLPDATLGLYLHIPFCRKRCKFCYFRVYTDKSNNEIQVYLDGLAREVSLYGGLPSVKGRKLKFVYFGGGTPSYISMQHLKWLAGNLKGSIPWDGAEEITFECEPGTITEAKLDAIKEIGVTRLSLGVENFDDHILEENGRAHHSQEIFRVLPWIKARNFDQVNIDLIAGMVGESWKTWRDSVQKTIDSTPDSVTIYQMELPFNTVFSSDVMSGQLRVPVADWETKRAWHDYAFEQLEKAGYLLSSAYTMVRKDKKSDFVYRNAIWHGSDMLGTGVASFSHMSGVHFQNFAVWDQYLGSLEANELPLHHAFATAKDERLTREMILQLKLGEIRAEYFQEKFGVNLASHFGEAYKKLQQEGFLTFDADHVQLTRKGLLQVDQLLPEFYDSKYRRVWHT